MAIKYVVRRAKSEQCHWLHHPAGRNTCYSRDINDAHVWDSVSDIVRYVAENGAGGDKLTVVEIDETTLPPIRPKFRRDIIREL